jgi:hypothetical protein
MFAGRVSSCLILSYLSERKAVSLYSLHRYNHQTGSAFDLSYSDGFRPHHPHRSSPTSGKPALPPASWYSRFRTVTYHNNEGVDGQITPGQAANLDVIKTVTECAGTTRDAPFELPRSLQVTPATAAWWVRRCRLHTGDAWRSRHPRGR